MKELIFRMHQPGVLVSNDLRLLVVQVLLVFGYVFSSQISKGDTVHSQMMPRDLEGIGMREHISYHSASVIKSRNRSIGSVANLHVLVGA